MMRKSDEMEEKALRYLEERKVRPGDIFRVLREEFEMPVSQAYEVAERSKQSYTFGAIPTAGGAA